MSKDTSAVHVWLILWKAYESVNRYATQQISSLNICMSDFAILEILLHKGPLTINEIGRRLALTSGSMTTAIDRLERRELVTREFKEDDRRARYVCLTQQGRKLIKKAFEEHSQALEDVALNLSTQERRTLMELLKRFGKSAEAAAMHLS